MPWLGQLERCRGCYCRWICSKSEAQTKRVEYNKSGVSYSYETNVKLLLIVVPFH